MKISIIRHLLLLTGLAFMITSCEVDPIGPIGGEDPTVSVTGVPQGGIEAGSTFSITVSAEPSSADAPLDVLEITEDGTAIPFSRLTVNGLAASSNPILLFDPDKNGLTWTIDIVAHGDASTKEYSVIVEDESNNTDAFSFDVMTNVNAPSLNVQSSGEFNVSPSALIALPVTFAKGTYDVASIGVYENDALIEDLNRISYNDLTNYFDENPYLVPEADKEGAEVTLYVRVQDEISTNAYRLVVTDEDGNSTSFDFMVTTETPVVEITGILFNSAGPTGTGGLDLDDAVGVGSEDPSAEIKDEGIDLDLPAESNWIQRISAVNGSIIKYVIPGEGGVSETFTYEDVTSKEAVGALFENGVDFTDTNGEGELVSGVVQEGDMFTIQNGDNYYLIIIRDVNVVTTDNSDSYEIDIKY